MEELKRMDFSGISQDALRALYILGNYMNKSDIEHNLREMIEVRISQINGCAYCLDMHWKIARSLGESEQRLYGLSAWRESPYYTSRERAALAWAEAVAVSHVPNDVYREASAHFSEKDLVDITMLVNLIGSWNRLNVSFANKETGKFVVGQYGNE